VFKRLRFSDAARKDLLSEITMSDVFRFPMCRSLLSVLLLTAPLGACGVFNEAAGFYIQDATYADMGEVRKDNAISRGWIPGHLPGTAHGIRERHSGDTNEGWGTFRFPEWDAETLAAYWRKVPEAPLPRNLNRFREAPKVDWWPQDIDDFAFYAGIEDRSFWLAVDFTNNVGYFWQGG